MTKRCEYQQLVKLFMDKHGFKSVLNVANTEDSDRAFDLLRSIELSLSAANEKAKCFVEDDRIGRMQLMTEELLELCQALMDRDQRALRDAVGDLLVTVFGTAEKFGITAIEDYRLIHKSNMTKQVGGHKPAKGESFEPPQL